MKLVDLTKLVAVHWGAALEDHYMKVPSHVRTILDPNVVYLKVEPIWEALKKCDLHIPNPYLNVPLRESINSYLFWNLIPGKLLIEGYCPSHDMPIQLCVDSVSIHDCKFVKDTQPRCPGCYALLKNLKLGASYAKYKVDYTTTELKGTSKYSRIIFGKPDDPFMFVLDSNYPFFNASIEGVIPIPIPKGGWKKFLNGHISAADVMLQHNQDLKILIEGLIFMTDLLMTHNLSKTTKDQLEENKSALEMHIHTLFPTIKDLKNKQDHLILTTKRSKLDLNGEFIGVNFFFLKNPFAVAKIRYTCRIFKWLPLCSRRFR